MRGAGRNNGGRGDPGPPLPPLSEKREAAGWDLSEADAGNHACCGRDVLQFLDSVERSSSGGDAPASASEARGPPPVGGRAVVTPQMWGPGGGRSGSHGRSRNILAEMPEMRQVVFPPPRVAVAMPWKRSAGLCRIEGSAALMLPIVTVVRPRSPGRRTCPPGRLARRAGACAGSQVMSKFHRSTSRLAAAGPAPPRAVYRAQRARLTSGNLM